jgi:SAM-dependent methyltransferase
MEKSITLNAPVLQERQELADWSEHWSESNQKNIAQRFFSVYRKAVFARGVSYFVERYFPEQGLLVEAGSGTAETSMRINKHRDKRKLVAVDIVLPVLERVHPIMDARMCADIFHLPFQDNALDGLWNVGVMEHFTHPQIDEIMREFYRVLKPGSCVILLIPGADSIPQRMLRVVERFINLRRRAHRFRFHPDEISQIQSRAQAQQILTKPGFRVLEIEPGWRTGFAFKTLVGRKV